VYQASCFELLTAQNKSNTNQIQIKYKSNKVTLFKALLNQSSLVSVFGVFG